MPASYQQQMDSITGQVTERRMFLFFFSLVFNRCFQEEAASRRRNLYLRRFSVVPVTEDCGIVEWVLATRPMRHCITEAYLRDGILLDTGPANHAVKARYEAACAGADPNTVPLPRLVTWLNTTLAGFPPIFHRWFLGRFPEPAAWFNARLAYTRTYAAWCMVGHVVGESWLPSQASEAAWPSVWGFYGFVHASFPIVCGFVVFIACRWASLGVTVCFLC